MAHMYPADLTPAEGRHGEYLVYSMLRDALPEPSWHIFHSLRFHLDKSGTRSRELDFIVLHPDRGCLVIEVKGGQYAYEPKLGWCHVYRGNYQPDTARGGPYTQVETGARALNDVLTSHFRWDPRALPYVWGTAVAFPHCTLDRLDGHLPADANGDITAEEAVFQSPERLRAWLLRRFGQIGGQFRRNDLFREQFNDVIRGFFAPRVKAHARLAAQIARTSQLEPMLTTEQQAAVKLLEDQPRVLVAGFAGTGKTFMAVLRAVRLYDRAPADAKPSIAIVCYNANLAEFIRREMLPTDADIEALTFHSLVERVAERTGVSTPRTKDQHYFEYGCVDILEEAFCEGATPPFDALIVDEGQDFRPKWIEALEQTALKTGGSFAVFYDPYQDVYGVGNDLPERFGKPFKVTTNCRNTKCLCTFIRDTDRERLRDMEPSAFALDGFVPRVIEYKSPEQQVKRIEQLVQQLIEDHDLKPSQIILLSPQRRENTTLAEVEAIAGYRLVDASRRYTTKSQNVLFYETFMSFKGLEAPCVIVFDLARGSGLAESKDLYVAFSRPRHGLFVLREAGWTLPQENAQ